MPTLTINGQRVAAPDGATILEAARGAGVGTTSRVTSCAAPRRRSSTSSKGFRMSSKDAAAAAEVEKAAALHAIFSLKLESSKQRKKRFSK